MCSQSPRGVPIQEGTRYLATMINRPPKAPTWRDVKQDTTLIPSTSLSSKRGERSERGKSARMPDHLGFSDLSLAHRSRSEGNDLSRLGLSSKCTTTYHAGLSENRAATLPHLKHHKKHKNRLHRTRSQYSIEKTDLPEMEQMTRNLAEIKAKDFGLRNKRPLDARVYFDENTRKCEKWLAGVHASQPPFSQEMGIPEEHSSDQDSVSGVTKQGKQKKAGGQTANSSGSDVDSASVYGVKQASDRKDPFPNRSKSQIPMPEGHRKHRLPQRVDESPEKQTVPSTGTAGQSKKSPTTTDSNKNELIVEHGMDVSAHGAQQGSGLKFAVSSSSTEINPEEPGTPRDSQQKNINSTNTENTTNSHDTGTEDVIISQEEAGVQNNNSELQDVESITTSEEIFSVAVPKTGGKQYLQTHEKGVVQGVVPRNSITGSLGKKGGPPECFSVPGLPGYVGPGSDNIIASKALTANSPMESSTTDITGSSNNGSLHKHDLTYANT